MIVDEWIDEYHRDETNGLVRLLQFFVTASGSQVVVTRTMVETLETNELIKSLTDDFAEITYPLVATGAGGWKKFRQNTAEFISV